jgi:hypothetical protein
MKRAFASIVICLLAATVCSAQVPSARVTFQQLLAHPEKFVGKRVDVTGYCHTSVEELSLSASRRADERNSGYDESIWLDVPTGQSRNIANITDLERKTVRVIGTFRYQPRPVLDKSVPYERRYRGFGSYKLWAHEITEITYFQPAQ